MPDKRQHDEQEQMPGVAIRRHTDRCFHEVEEVVYDGPPGDSPGDVAGCQPGDVSGVTGTAAGAPGAPGVPGVVGYIIDGVMIDADDVAEVRHVADGGDRPACRET